METRKLAIRRTPQNYKSVNAYFHKQTGMDYTANGTWMDKQGNSHPHDWLVIPRIGATTVFREIPQGYEEVLWGAFRANCRKPKTKKFYYEIY